ncbi:MAG: aminoglycoside 6-adenylyltransferase [Fibrobacteres bacterium]|nr:aminoglycoside 6-adenylyltransferase [Fibrobacterota bacterium]
MRTKEEMLDIIMSTARTDERIRAVIMNGSRVNPNVSPDIFQDFDIIYIVTEVAPFKNNYDWIARFGELMVMQEPDDMPESATIGDNQFAYLMQFTDGNRIDLTIYPMSKLDALEEDSLSVLLLDKDGIVKPFLPPSESSYLPKPPTAKSYFNCCNEFWWVAPYAAKGLWREQITYSKHILDDYMRKMLMKMFVWHIGINTNFSVNTGIEGKYFKKYLEPKTWEKLEKTYSDAGYHNTWESLIAMFDLFREVAINVANHYGFTYPYDDDKRVSAHLKHVRGLPKDAKAVY